MQMNLLASSTSPQDDFVSDSENEDPNVEYKAVRFLLGTNVNTPFFQVPTPEFWHGARARVQGLDLVLEHCSGH